MAGQFVMPDAEAHGTGDNGAIWDPSGGPDGKGAWRMPQGGANPNDAGHTANIGPYSIGDGANGSVGGTGRVRDPNAWGGYSGTRNRDANGNLYVDPMVNGTTEDVNRYQGMGAAAAARGAYQNDYSQANQYAGLANQSRGYQNDAVSIARNQALYGNQQSMQLGHNMLDQGAQAQQAAALSTRGGSLAQAAAMRQQQGGQAAYMQQGNNALLAQQADDMAAGRAAYSGLANSMRAGDVTATGLAVDQATAQAQNEEAQRRRNSQAQRGYEGMGLDTQVASAQSAERQEAIGQQVGNQNRANADADKGRTMRIFGAGLGAAASLATRSDERFKMNVKPMGIAGAHAARKGGY